MGNADSSMADVATRFLPPEKFAGAVIAAFHDSSEGPEHDSVITVYRDFVAVFNATSGDRRLRIITPAPVLCAAYARDTCLGSIIALGTLAGTVELMAAQTLKRLRTLRSRAAIESAVFAGGRLTEEYERARAAGDVGGEHGSGRSAQLAITCVYIMDCVRLAAGTGRGEAHVFALDSARELLTLLPPSSDVGAVADEVDDLDGGRARASSTGDLAGGPGFAPSPVRCMTHCVVGEEGAREVAVVGHADGAVRCYCLISGARLAHGDTGSGESGGTSEWGPVTSLTAITLAAPVAAFPAEHLPPPPEAYVVGACLHATFVRIWRASDMSRSVVVRMRARSDKRSTASRGGHVAAAVSVSATSEAAWGGLVTTLAMYAPRQMIIVGAGDGSLYLQRIVLAPPLLKGGGETQGTVADIQLAAGAHPAARAASDPLSWLAIATLRAFHPANREATNGHIAASRQARATSSKAKGAVSPVPPWVTSLHYDPYRDTLAIGDVTGVARQVRELTGEAPTTLLPRRAPHPSSTAGTAKGAGARPHRAAGTAGAAGGGAALPASKVVTEVAPRRSSREHARSSGGSRAVAKRRICYERLTPHGSAVEGGDDDFGSAGSGSGTEEEFDTVGGPHRHHSAAGPAAGGRRVFGVDLGDSSDEEQEDAERQGHQVSAPAGKTGMPGVQRQALRKDTGPAGAAIEMAERWEPSSKAEGAHNLPVWEDTLHAADDRDDFFAQHAPSAVTQALHGGSTPTAASAGKGAVMPDEADVFDSVERDVHDVFGSDDEDDL